MPRYQIERALTIGATADDAYRTVADYSTWTTWSPWLCAEPDAEVTVSSDPASVGSVYAWKGKVTGEGELEHLKLERGRLIDDEIRFFKPFRSKSAVSFRFEPVSNGTRVVWSMDGSLPWFLFWMKSMLTTYIGMDYDRGLKMLKDYIETGSIPSQCVVHGVESIDPLRMAGVRRQSVVSEIGRVMENAVDEARSLFSQHGMPLNGEMISVYHRFDVGRQIFDFTTGFVLPDSTGSVPDSLSQWSTGALQAFRVEHIGSYNHLGNGWSAANQIVRYRKLRQSKGGTFEIYRNSPGTTPEVDLRTDIYLPLR